MTDSSAYRRTSSRPSSGVDIRHLAAVQRSLAWADDAADHGDLADALSWLQTIERIGDPLPPEYRAKRDRWRETLDRRREG